MKYLLVCAILLLTVGCLDQNEIRQPKYIISQDGTGYSTDDYRVEGTCVKFTNRYYGEMQVCGTYMIRQFPK